MAESKSEFQKTAGNAGIIGLTAMGGAIFGFILQLLVAYYFGAGAKTDAYFMAQSTSDLLSKLLLGGSIASLFIPIFIHTMQHHSREEAWRQALNIIHITCALFLFCILLIGLFAVPFVHFIAPGFTPSTSTLTVHILWVLLPSFFLQFMVDMGTSMLNSLKQFAIPASMRMVDPLITALVVLITVHPLGIYSLAWGTVIGTLTQMFLIAYALRRQGLRYRFVFQPFDSSLKRMMKLVSPFIISMLVTQAAGLVYRILVSHLAPGSLASLKFAEKITQLLTIIFLTSVTSVIYPILAEKSSRADTNGMRETIASAIRLITFISVPIIIGVGLLRHQIIAVIYQRGSFDAVSAAQTSTALLFLVIGLTINGISAVFGYSVLAMQKTKASVVVTVASQIVSIILFYALVPLMGLAGLALGSSLTPIAITLLYFIYLTRFVPYLWHVFWHKTYLKIAVLSTALYVLVRLIMPLTANLTTPFFVTNVVQIFIPAALGASLYFFAAYLWNIEEIHEVMQIVQRRLRKLTNKTI